MGWVSFLVLISNSVTAQSVANSQISSEELADYKSLFIQVAVLLGVSLLAYLYVNFRNNQKKRISHDNTREFVDNKSDSTLFNIKQFVNHLPYPACIVTKEGLIEECNLMFIALTNQNRNANYHQVWYKYLQFVDCLDQLDELNDGTFNATTNEDILLKVTMKPLHLTEGELLYSILLEDVTHLRIELTNITKRVNYFQEMIDNSPVAILIEDIEGRILLANQTICNLLEIDNTELVKRNFMEFCPDSLREHFLEQIEALKIEKWNRFSSYLINANGKNIPVKISLSAISFFGKRALTYIIEDNSEWLNRERELKEAKQKAEESERLKSSFLSNMSHEVRTPMNCILGFTELMCDNQLSTSERKEFHQIVKTSAYELLDLVNDIIELSKIESGIIKLECGPLDLDELCQNLFVYAHDLLAHSPGLKYVFKENEQSSSFGFIESDQNRVLQILKQLIENAAKYTPSGSIQFSYLFRKDRSIDFIIKDTGIGIPKNKLPIIFHKFRQAQDENNRDFGGAGLGLNICIQLAKYLGGFVWASSELDIGTDFHFVLPQSKIEEEGKTSYRGTILLYSSMDPDFLFENKLNEFQIYHAFSQGELIGIPIANKVSAILLINEVDQDVMKHLVSIASGMPVFKLVGQKLVTVNYSSKLSFDINNELEVEVLKDYFTDELKHYH